MKKLEKHWKSSKIVGKIHREIGKSTSETKKMPPLKVLNLSIKYFWLKNSEKYTSSSSSQLPSKRAMPHCWTIATPAVLKMGMRLWGGDWHPYSECVHVVFICPNCSWTLVILKYSHDFQFGCWPMSWVVPSSHALNIASPATCVEKDSLEKLLRV